MDAIVRQCRDNPFTKPLVICGCVVTALTLCTGQIYIASCFLGAVAVASLATRRICTIATYPDNSRLIELISDINATAVNCMKITRQFICKTANQREYPSLRRHSHSYSNSDCPDPGPSPSQRASSRTRTSTTSNTLSVEEEVEILLQYVVRDFFTSWFKAISPDTKSIDDARCVLQSFVAAFISSLSEVDIEMVFENWLAIYTQHLHAMLSAKSALEHGNGTMTLSEFLASDKQMEMFESSSLPRHRSLQSSETELEYLREMVEQFIQAFMPDDVRDYDSLTQILNESFTCNVLLPTVEKITEPNWLHSQINAMLSSDHQSVTVPPTSAGESSDVSDPVAVDDVGADKQARDLRDTTLEATGTFPLQRADLYTHYVIADTSVLDCRADGQPTSADGVQHAFVSSDLSKHLKLVSDVETTVTVTPPVECVVSPDASHVVGDVFGRIPSRRGSVFSEAASSASISSVSSSPPLPFKSPLFLDPDALSLNSTSSDPPESTGSQSDGGFSTERVSPLGSSLQTVGRLSMSRTSDGARRYDSDDADDGPAGCHDVNDADFDDHQPGRHDAVDTDDYHIVSGPDSPVCSEQLPSTSTVARTSLPKQLFEELVVSGTETVSDRAGPYTLFIVSFKAWYTSADGDDVVRRPGLAKRRHREFVCLHERLQTNPHYRQQLKGLKSPPSRWTTVPFGNMAASQVERRVLALQVYLQALIGRAGVQDSCELKEFLVYDAAMRVTFSRRPTELPRLDKVISRSVSGLLDRVGQLLPGAPSVPPSGPPAATHLPDASPPLEDWTDTLHVRVKVQKGSAFQTTLTRCRRQLKSDAESERQEASRDRSGHVTGHMTRSDGDGCEDASHVITEGQVESCPALARVTTDLAVTLLTGRSVWLLDGCVFEFVRGMTARPLDRWLRSWLSQLSSAARCAGYVRRLRDAVWPSCHQGAARDATCERGLAADSLRKLIPEWLRMAVGRDHCHHSIETFLSSLDDPTVNRHLFYFLLDDLLQVILPAHPVHPVHPVHPAHPDS